MQNLSKDPARYVYHRCTRDKRSSKLYSVENDMDPGIVPSQLEGLTQIEEMLIARVCPIMSVYRKHGGQRGYRGHVLNLPQDIQPKVPLLGIRYEAKASAFVSIKCLFAPASSRCQHDYRRAKRDGQFNEW